MSSDRSKRRRIHQEVQSEIENVISLSKSLASSVVVNQVENNYVHLSQPPICSRETIQQELVIDLENTITKITPSVETVRPPFKDLLVSWSLTHNITHSALDDLLVLLKPVVDNSVNLPKCAKTLLHTPKLVTTSIIKGGKFTYFGIENQLLKLDLNFDSHCSFPILEKFQTAGQKLLTINVPI